MPLGCVLITAFNLDDPTAMGLSNRLKDENPVSLMIRWYNAATEPTPIEPSAAIRLSSGRWSHDHGLRLMDLRAETVSLSSPPLDVPES
jgi:hypothetical protein